MNLSVIRHGQTFDNLDGTIQGQQPGQLTELGVCQARDVAQLVSKEVHDALYSSDLARCVDTARHILDLTPLPFTTDKALREKAFGIYEGKPSSSVKWDRFQSGNNYKQRIPGGESFYDLFDRVSTYINGLLVRHHNDNLIVVTHGGPMRIIKSACDDIPLSELTHQSIPNCAVWRFVINSTLEMNPDLWT